MESEQEAERVVGAYGKLLSAVVRGILRGNGTEEDAEECVQDVFAEYLRSPQKLDEGRGSEKTYLCVLARSRALSLRRRLMGRQEVPLEEEFSLTAPDEMEVFQVRAALLAALGGLTEEERRLFTLRFVYEWDITGSARELGISRSAVTTRTQRLRKKLKKLLALQGLSVEKEDTYALRTE